MKRYAKDDRREEELDALNIRIGARVRDARMDRQITQSILAQALGRSLAWVSKLELGGGSVNPLDLLALSRLTRYPVDFFVGAGDVEMHGTPVTLEDWRKLFPGDPTAADAHWTLAQALARRDGEMLEKRKRVRVMSETLPKPAGRN